MAEIKKWRMEGIVMECEDGGHSRAGILSQEDVQEFLNVAASRYPDAKVMVHAFGLRITKYEDDKGCGPKLDWRDWD